MASTRFARCIGFAGLAGFVDRGRLGILVATVAAAGLAASGARAEEPIVVADEIPYADPEAIQQKIRSECPQLNRQLADFIRQYAAESGVAVTAGDPAKAKGRALRVEITNAMSQGNAFMGHAKSSSARGTLLEGGKEVASFRATRNSMGGAFAGFKGSCAVLGRTMQALGRDIGTWLASPVDDADLGDR